MINKCIVCNKEFKALRPSKRTCSDTCRQKYHRGNSTVTKIVPIVTKKDTVTSTVTVSVTNREGEKELIFTKETPLKERIEKYKELYPNSGFIPNWIAHGFNSKEEAIKAAIRAVERNQGIINLGFDV